MLLRLLKSNMMKSAFARRPACYFDVICSFNNSCASILSIGKPLTVMHLGGGLFQCSLPSIVGHLNSARLFHKLRIRNLPENATEELIRVHFSQFGMVLSARLVRDAETLESKRRGYVVFADKEALDTCMSYQPQVIGNKIVTLLSSKEIAFLVCDVSPSTTQESLHAYFSRYGKVSRCHVRNSMKGNCMGFVNYDLGSNVDLELASKVHVIDGKQVKIRRMFPKELTQYVGNLSPSTTDESLAAYYSQFGRLLQAEVVKDRWTRESRGFGYITFSSQQEFDNALRSVPHIIDGKEVRHEYVTQEFTLFVATLSPCTSEQSLKQYFQQFGPVYECKIAHDKQANQLRDFGWVTFSSQKGLNGALASRPHTIDGKRIDVCRVEEQGGRAFTLFVGGLSPRTTGGMLHAVFSKFGSLVYCDVKYDRMSGKPRGFGHVSYSSLDEVSKALLACPHVVDGKVVAVVLKKDCF